MSNVIIYLVANNFNGHSVNQSPSINYPQGTPVEELAEKLLLPAQEVEWHLDHYHGINERRKQAAHTRKNKQKNNLGMSSFF